MILELVRWPLGQLILLVDRLTAPSPPRRHPEDQARIDQAMAGLALYQFRTCPFCVKTRRAMRRLGIDIEMRDARRDPTWRRQLISQGGRLQVPCLAMPDASGGATWLYESNDIIAYLVQTCARLEHRPGVG